MKYDKDKLKNIDIVNWLDKHGYKKHRGSGKYVSYYSMLGQENNPSFKVNQNNNRWKDYHSNKWGDIIQLVREIEGCSYNEACAILSEDGDINIKEYTPQKSLPGVKVHLVDNITDSELIEYACVTRKIDKNVLLTNCKEVSFSFPFSEKDNKKIYKAIGFPTAMKSWELRNSYMKIATPPKSFSKIVGSSGSKDIYNLFEGFMDFLAALTYWGVTQLKYDSYILNGVHQIRLIKPFLDGKKVNFFADADSAGDELFEKLDNCDVIDQRFVFGFYDDFAEFVKNK